MIVLSQSCSGKTGDQANVLLLNVYDKYLDLHVKQRSAYES